MLDKPLSRSLPSIMFKYQIHLYFGDVNVTIVTDFWTSTLPTRLVCALIVEQNK